MSGPSVLLLSTQTGLIAGNFNLNSPNVPAYAILSHTWLPMRYGAVAEVIHSDLTNPSKVLQLQRGQVKTGGWAKLQAFCRTARHEGYEYAWMDTCCINKASQSHTSMAINNMQHYYNRAAVCYAYLDDVSLHEIGYADWPERGRHEREFAVSSSNNREIPDVWAGVKRARWFKRVWTLQELMAPCQVHLRDKHWKLIGEKREWATVIRMATGLRSNHLYPLEQDEAVAQKLHWASERNVTKMEDEAYGILGLFNMTLALRYGEGLRAFSRLQKEMIIRGEPYVDATILAWQTRNNWSNPGLLAPSLKHFRHAGQLVPAFRMGGIRWDNGCVVIKAIMYRKPNGSKKSTYFAAFMYRNTDESRPHGPPMGIYLESVDSSGGQTRYKRINHGAGLDGPNQRKYYTRLDNNVMEVKIIY